MKLKFKVQPYQTNAVESVADYFAGQPMTSGLIYRIDPGRAAQVSAFDEGFTNADLVLSEAQILENIQKVQRRQNLPVSSSLSDFTGSRQHQLQRLLRSSCKASKGATAMVSLPDASANKRQPSSARA